MTIGCVPRSVGPAIAILLAGTLSSTTADAQSAPVVGQLEAGDDPVTLAVGQSEPLSQFVTARNKRGRLITSPRLTFVSLDPSIVEVSGETAVGVKPGSAMVVVSPDVSTSAIEDTLTVTVVQAYESSAVDTTASGAAPAPSGDTAAIKPPSEKPLAQLPAGTVLVPEPNPLPLLVSERETIRALARRQGDNSVVGPVAATWESLSPEIVRVDASGNVTGVGVGTGVVQVTPAGGAARTVSVTVDTVPFAFVRQQLAIPVGQQRTTAVTVPRQGNRALDNLMLGWRSTNEAIAMVGADGTITGREPGRADIIVTAFLRTDTLPVIVHPVVETVSFPAAAKPVEVPLRGTVRHQIVALGSTGDTVRGVPILWNVKDPTIVAVDTAAQTLTGTKVGTTQLTVQIEGFKTGTWAVNVTPPAIALAMDRLALSLGEQRRLIANMVDTSGRTIAPLDGGQWQSSGRDVVAVSQTGELQAGKLGRGTVVITGPAGKSDTVEVFVVADLLLTTQHDGKPRGLYQISLARPDSLVPLAADSLPPLTAAYSADRTQIAYATASERSVSTTVMEADGQGARTILRMPGQKAALAWMPDGQRLVFAIGDKKRSTMGLLDVGAATWDTLMVVSGEPSPAVSASGTIAYVQGDENRSDIYTLKPPSRTVTRLTNTPYPKWSPQWLPDGDILFVTDDKRQKERFQIVRFSPKTSSQTPVVRSQQPLLTVAVSRDGRRIAYTVKGKDKRKPTPLFVRDIGPGSQPREIVLRPEEGVTALGF